MATTEWMRYAIIGTMMNPVNKDVVDKQLVDSFVNDKELAKEVLKTQNKLDKRYYKKMLAKLYKEECQCDFDSYICKVCRRISKFEEKLDKFYE